jgi:hypothetical protein
MQTTSPLSARSSVEIANRDEGSFVPAPRPAAEDVEREALRLLLMTALAPDSSSEQVRAGGRTLLRVGRALASFD